jgi:hypothetical protein
MIADVDVIVIALLLFAYLLLFAIALLEDLSRWLLAAGAVMFLLSFEVWTVTANFPATIAIVVVGIVTLFEGIPRQGSGD